MGPEESNFLVATANILPCPLQVLQAVQHTFPSPVLDKGLISNKASDNGCMFVEGPPRTTLPCKALRM